jgi:hypothetical protein
MISPDTSTIVAVLLLKDVFKGRKEHLLRIKGLFRDENFPCSDAVWGTSVYEGGAPCEAAVGKGLEAMEAWKRRSVEGWEGWVPQVMITLSADWQSSRDWAGSCLAER